MAAFFIAYGDNCSILAYAKGVDDLGADSDPSTFPSWAPT